MRIASGQRESCARRLSTRGAARAGLPSPVHGKRFCGLAVCAAVLGLFATRAPAQVAGRGGADQLGGYPSTYILFRLKPEAHTAVWKGVDRRNAVATASLEPRLSRAMRATCERWGVTNVRPAFTEGFAHPDLAAKHGLDRLYVAEVPQGTDTPAMATAVAAHLGEVEIAGVDAIGGIADVFPDDPAFSIQYHLYNDGTPDTGSTMDACPDNNVVWCAGSDINAPAAWEMTTGSPDVVVAILDSGVTPHPEFEGRLLTGRNFATTGGQSANNTTDQCLSTGHGTHVAGIAAARGNNAMGVAGVAWDVQILPVRVVGNAAGPCSGSAIDLASGITWAADHGADIINMSLQFYPTTGLTTILRELLQSSINYAHAAGCVLIAAAGNNNGGGLGVVAYPGASANTLAVSATNACDQFATQSNSGFFSNYGPEVDICAPGDDIYSTSRNAQSPYNCISGTSMATPMVSGVAALMKSHVPALTNCSIEGVIKASVLDLGPVGWDDHYGFGRVDAALALVNAENWPQISATVLPADAIDAGWPHPTLDTSVLLGWSEIEVTFRGDVARVSQFDFQLTQEGGVASTPIIASVIEGSKPENLIVQLDSAIPPGAWTTLTHGPSCTALRLGYLPGDVDANRRSDMDDVQALIDALDQVGDPRPLWSTDINRSGQTTPADLIDLADTLTGANFNEPYLNRTLPD